MHMHFSHFTDNRKLKIKVSYGKDARNKCDFSLDLKFCREFDDVTSVGKLFHVGSETHISHSITQRTVR